jgi:hypothetical protein
MHFYGISFMHPHKQSGRWQNVVDHPAHPSTGHTAYMDA